MKEKILKLKKKHQDERQEIMETGYSVDVEYHEGFIATLEEVEKMLEPDTKDMAYMMLMLVGMVEFVVFLIKFVG